MERDGVKHGGRRAGGLLAACLAASACAGGEGAVRSTLYDPAHPLEARPPDAPVAVLADQGPECPYEAIATIAVAHRGELPSRETTEAMARETRRIGGDGIMRFTALEGQMRATAFRYTNPSCMQ